MLPNVLYLAILFFACLVALALVGFVRSPKPRDDGGLDRERPRNHEQALAWLYAGGQPLDELLWYAEQLPDRFHLEELLRWVKYYGGRGGRPAADFDKAVRELRRIQRAFERDYYEMGGEA